MNQRRADLLLDCDLPKSQFVSGFQEPRAKSRMNREGGIHDLAGDESSSGDGSVILASWLLGGSLYDLFSHGLRKRARFEGSEPPRRQGAKL